MCKSLGSGKARWAVLNRFLDSGQTKRGTTKPVVSGAVTNMDFDPHENLGGVWILIRYTRFESGGG